MARPTKLNKALQNQLVKLVKMGVTVADACAHVGISEAIFYIWMSNGSAGDVGYVEFFEDINRARNAAKVTAIRTLHAALSPTVGKSVIVDTFTETKVDTFGHETKHTTVKEHEVTTTYPADWKAAVEYLKRRFPGEWSEKRILELGLSDDLLKRLEDIAKQAEIPASALFEQMVNALATQLQLSGEDSVSESADADSG